jgi:two-component system response regulator (stage 0 sporulation protein A)
VSKDSCRENRDLSATVPILSFPTASAVSDGPLIIEKPILNVKKETTRLLHEIGVPANLKGHNYLRDAVLMVLEDRKLINSVTKTIYPSIGQRYDTSACSVERAIRTALETAWTRGKTEILNNLFGFTVNINKGKPTNAEFIALIADKLSLDCS